MEKFGKSQPVTRREDVRFLTGTGGYVDDVAPANALHAYFFRSPVAHGEITALDVEEARAMPGVACVLVLDDLREAGLDVTMQGHRAKNIDGSEGAAPTRCILADGRVRHVGEPIALIAAETLEQAKDAAEAIGFEYADLPVHVARAVGGEAIHDEAPDNLAYDFGLGDNEAVEAAFAKAAKVVRYEIGDNRVVGNAMEPRGAYAEWNGDKLHVCFSGQGPWGVKRDLARILKLDEAKVRVSHPDVGGGFGIKAASYPEYFVLAHAARITGRPVRWMADRTETMISDHAGRDIDCICEMAFDENHRILAYRVNSVANLGAYNSGFGQGVQSFCFSRVMMGTYDVQDVWLNNKGVYTNTTQVDAYRGAGRPEAIYALERTMDYAARELGVSPWELRRINFIKPESFPYRSATGETYDVGEFDRVMSRCMEEADVAGFDARRESAEARGKLYGMGVCYYIESILGDFNEHAHVEFLPNGRVNLYVGTQSNGQGHETVFAQFLSDQTGIPAELIDVIQGDSDRIPEGGGTGGSRSVTMQNNATLAVSGTMIEKFGEFLAGETGVDPSGVSFDDEHFRVEGSNATPSILDVAELARQKGREDLLSFRQKAKVEARSFPNGCHICEVEVDPDTGAVKVTRYTVTDDFGNLINPMLAEGQVHGGVVQGIGQALMEDCIYDDDGQILSATFMDYAMPRAVDVPFMKFVSEPVPSTANVMGMKGCGEAGTVGSMAATANAVMDALSSRGVTRGDMPFTPHRVWQLLEAGAGAS